MAEQDNIRLAELQIAALNARDLDTYTSRIDDAYEGKSDTAPGPIRGRAGSRQYIETILAGFPDCHIEIEQVIASGDTVVVRFRTTGTHQGVFAGIAPTHKHMDVEACNVLEMRNGKTVKGRLYMDTATLFRQLGVLSLPKANTAAG